MRSSQGRGPIPWRMDGKVLPEKAAEREPTALARPACMSGRGVKEEGPPQGQGMARATRHALALRGCLKISSCTNGI